MTMSSDEVGHAGNEPCVRSPKLNVKREVNEQKIAKGCQRVLTF